MDSYRTSGVLDERALGELKKFYLPGWFKGGFGVVGVFFALIALLSLVDHWSPFYTVYTLLLSLFFFLYPRCLTRLYVRNAVRRRAERLNVHRLRNRGGRESNAFFA